MTEDFSNLTLDTVALCTMDFRFNSFYRDGAHPFVDAMNTKLGAAGSGQSRIPILSTALSLIGAGASGADIEKVAQADAFIKKTALEIIDQRRNSPMRRDDFLDSLLFGKDPKTGESMRDELITAQMQAFLIAGHETTSGLLSFAVIFLLQNPETYRKAQSEVDQVIGDDSITLQHIKNLKYVYAVLQETLRLSPSAPLIGKIPHPNLRGQVVTLGGKYQIEPTERVRILLGKSMQDPKIFGEDADQFKPERMLDSNPDHDRFESYWRPFSEGSRGCIGRDFSLQESILALAIILQNFDLRLTDPMYKMQIRHRITIKPLGLYIKASLRHGMTPLDLERRLYTGAAAVEKKQATTANHEKKSNSESGPPLNILFGTNTGTCSAMAQRLASEVASRYGFSPQVDDLDAAVGKIPKDYPTVIITSSYEGEPPDNALQFVHYLEDLKSNEVEGVKYAVFGCGHKDWHATFHRIPKLINDMFEARGGNRLAEIGLSDVSQGNAMADFENWLDEILLPQLKALSPQSAESSDENLSNGNLAEVSTGERPATLRQDLLVGTVKDVKVLTAAGEQPQKRHMEVELPAGSAYECGDYLAVLPQGPDATVRAVMSHFKLPNDASIVLKSKVFSPLPLDTSLSVADLLKNYYELAQPATRRALTMALRHTKDKNVQDQLSSWLKDGEQFRSQVTEPRTSVLDLLKKFPQIEMPLPEFLSLLPPLSIRQYSISSSPLSNPETCTITYSVLTDEKDAERPFYGVATTYLSTLKAGDRMQVAVRRTAKQTFRLPLDAENTPLLMFAAGTGLAPFRGFIEQRAIQLESNPNTKLAPAHLFLGCRSSEKDRLYAAQIDEWERKGAVKIYYAFSQEPDKSNGCKHVDDRMLKEIDTISNAWIAGARAYVCGNRGFAQSVEKATRSIVEKRLEARKADGWSDKQVEDRKTAIFSSFSERAADDVFD